MSYLPIQNQIHYTSLEHKQNEYDNSLGTVNVVEDF